eukprot:scaffold8821_cov256-Chaetoceros_neogracile.AAC.3
MGGDSLLLNIVCETAPVVAKQTNTRKKKNNKYGGDWEATKLPSYAPHLPNVLYTPMMSNTDVGFVPVRQHLKAL